MKTFISKYHYKILLLLLFVIAFILRIRVEDPMFYDDSFVYYLRAIELFTHGTCSPIYWPLGYPLILTCSFYLLGESIHSAYSLTAFLGALIVFPVYFLAKELFDKKIAFLSALLIGIDPVHILISSGIWSNAPETLFITFAVFFILKFNKTEFPSYLYIATIFAALSTFIRYTSGILIIIFIIYIILSKSKQHILILIKKKEIYFAFLIFILVLTPQFIYNTLQYGNPLSTYYNIHNDLVFWSYRYLFEIPPSMQYPTTITYFYTILFWTFDLKSLLFFLSKSTFVPPLLVLFSFVGLIFLFRRKKYNEALLLSLWVFFTIIPFLFFFQSTLWQSSRILLSMHAPFIILGIYGVFKVTDMLNRKLFSLLPRGYNYSSIFKIIFFLPIIIPMILVSILIKPPDEGSIGRRIQKYFESPANKYVIFSVKRHSAFKDSHEWIKSNRKNETLVLGVSSYKNIFYAGEIFPLNTPISELNEKIVRANECYIIVSMRKGVFIDSPEYLNYILDAYNFKLIKIYDANFDEEKWQIYYKN